jgi:CubicO group peptidase (beta-lactamase class C family)
MLKVRDMVRTFIAWVAFVALFAACSGDSDDPTPVPTQEPTATVAATATATSTIAPTAVPTATAEPTGTPTEGPRAAAGLVDPERLDDVLGRYVERGELVGVSALVYEDGEEVFFGAYGMADREADRPMQRDTIVQLWSMTKPITGVTLMTLYEEGLFELDDPLAKYLPEFADIRIYDGQDGNDEPVLRPPARPPVVRDIMRHTAGFGDVVDEGWVGGRFKTLRPVSLQNSLRQMSEALASIPLLYEPGTRWHYGPSVDVQARLVEVLSDRPFADVMSERVLGPLSMHDTQFTVLPEQRDRLAAAYMRRADGSFFAISINGALIVNLQEFPLTPGGWGLTSTLDDYMRFAQMLLNEGELDGVRILQPETVRLMATDALPPDLADKSFLVNKGQVGFGIDFAVRIAPPANQAEASGAVGEFFWDGLQNTLFWVDPKNQITAVLFNVYRPWGEVEIQKDFRDAVYYRDDEASALNKAPAEPDSPRLSD